MASAMSIKRRTQRALLTKMEKSMEDVVKIKSVDLAHEFLEKLNTRERELHKCNDEIASEIVGDDLIEAEVTKIAEYDDIIAMWRVRLRKVIAAETQNGGSSVHSDPAGSGMVPPSAHGSSSSFGSAGSQQGISLRLPKFEMPKFNGDILQWPSFWDAFSSAVHEKQGLSSVDKFNFLKGVLTDEAARCIAGFKITEANYILVVDKLKQRFGRDELIIDGLTAALLRLSAPSSHPSAMRRFFDDVENKVLALKSLKVDVAACSPMLVSTLTRLLPAEYKLEWARIQRRTIKADIDALIEFLKEEIELRETAGYADSGSRSSESSRRSDVRSNPPRQDRPGRVGASTAALNVTVSGPSEPRPKKRGCFICDSADHMMWKCDLKTAKERSAKLRELNRCFNCIGGEHEMRDCPKERFSCKRCKGAHNTVLCPRLDKDSSITPITESTSEAGSVTVAHQCVNVCNVAGVVLLKSAVVLVDGESDQARVRLMVDGGSQGSFISHRLARRVGAKQVGVKTMALDVFGKGSGELRTHRKLSVRLFDHTGSNSVELILVEIDNVCSGYNSVPCGWIVNEMSRRGMMMADSGNESPCDFDGIDILIGSDLYWKIVTTRVEMLGESIAAVESVFGWLISGPDERQKVSCNTIVASHVCVNETVEERQLTEDVQKFWTLESMGIGSNENDTPTIDPVEENVYQTIKKVDDRYRVQLPWNEKKNELRTNLPEALKRFHTLVRKFGREEEKIIRYHRTMMEYVENGHAEVVPEGSSEGSVVYHIPHQAVFRTNHDTMKLRIVFDASSGRPSLNDCLHPGPHLNPDVLDMLLRFRQHPVALTADMEKAFLQVEIDPDDRDATRFIWLPAGWKPGDDVEPVVYRMKRVLFGLNCGPFLLAVTLKHHLRTVESVGQDVVKELTGNIYVDDLIKSVLSALMGWQLYCEGKRIMAEAGFNLRKWATNSPELRRAIAENEQGTDEFCDKSGEEFVKVLGIKWSQWSDVLQFDVSELMEYLAENAPTKRTVLSAMARIFDPLGLLGPFTMRIKCLVQDLWKEKLGWDEEIGERFLAVWSQWKSELTALQLIAIPRCVSCRAVDADGDEVILRQYHVFCDASEKVFGAVIYQVEQCGSQITSRLVVSKNKVAPVKTLTIPRLELMGALVAVRVMDTVKRATGELDAPITYWTDSMVVLYWVKGDPSRLKMFVGNRVREIREKSNPESWRHVRTAENPADKVTRGLSSVELQADQRWWTGPVWLTQGVIESDVTEDAEAEEIARSEEKKPTVVANAVVVPLPVIEVSRYSRWSKAVRVTAWIFRFAANTRKSPKVYGALSAEELNEAERRLILHEQKLMYPNEYDSLCAKKTVEKGSKLQRFDPQLGEDGLIRLGGRLHFSTLDLKIKHPIIVDGKSWAAQLLIQQCHERVLHGGVSETIVELREKFWVPSTRSCVKKVLNRCVVCSRKKAKPAEMVEAPLPSDRVEETAPFEVSGMDYAGPIYVREGKTNQRKTYILLITCAVTRAVHLELVRSLTADDFLLAFRRFVSRRGVCRIVWSDNAKTFKRAEKDLDIWSRMVSFANENRITWKFIADRAPWWGGLWERMVRSVKDKLKVTCGRAMLEFEELRTILVEVEGILNSRPLGYVSDESREVLTPAHLLIGKRLTAIPPASKPSEALTGVPEVGRRWRNRLVVLARYWKAWRQEYLLMLRTAHERRHPDRKDSLRPGQLVLLDDERTVRHLWKTCVIDEVIHGRDGNVRSCMIRTSDGKKMKRPIQLLYPLEAMD